MSRLLSSSLLPLLAILGSVTFLGLGTSWAKHTLFPLVGAPGTTAVRVGFSALLLLLIWRPWRWRLARGEEGAPGLRRDAGADEPDLLPVAAHHSLRLAVAIEFAGPLTVALLGSRRVLDFVWLLLAIAGLGLLLPLGHGVSTLDPVGVGWAIVAAVCWALYILFGKRVGHLHAGQSVAIGLTVAALTVVPVGVAQAGTALLSPVVLGWGCAWRPSPARCPSRWRWWPSSACRPRPSAS
jgi:inner membrane transporter RhtA